MNRIVRTALAACALSSLVACSKHPAASGGEAAAPHLPTLTVVAEHASREQTWDGVVEAVNHVTMTAQTNARVLELPHDVGDTVKAGDVLVRFTDIEQKSAHSAAQAQIASARASYVNAQAHYQRIAAIYDKHLVSKSDLDQALSARNAALAALRAAEANSREVGQRVDYTVVRAPFDGVVTHRYVHVGEAVQAGPPSPQKLIGLESLKNLRVTVPIPQSAMSAIERNHTAQVLLDGRPGQRVSVDRMVLVPYADPQTHTFDVRLDLSGEHAGLYPGMTVKVAFAVGSTQRLLVPASVLWHQGEVRAVYVLEGDTVLLRQVRTGEHYGDHVEVLSGLHAGDKVVTDPAAAMHWLATRHADASS
ncbi:efflux RND transporter periplasmic adaptor subunit [Oleiagrimonas sp. C23AA]|uniref:efflux RND transporter periplasmic adaptor subunit n=1 Tax=Oleiagrimonas sp. C23AA TaxID=2719047 RepID=UPI00141FE99D|nr:efflux RND transporter periplasmic adaptor subunit [Oleiagrimonas sp. C23AA]NII11834.1 efflux RND transporter periplasmic adaptor subunit [Oleiagrimonas sp. C23AA]